MRLGLLCAFGLCLASAAGPTVSYLPFRSITGERAGLVVLTRMVWTDAPGAHPLITDEVLATFVSLNLSADALKLAEVGQCATYEIPKRLATPWTSPLSVFTRALPGSGIDAGQKITLALAQHATAVPSIPGATGVYRREVGSSSRPEGLFWTAANYVVHSSGSKSVARFATQVAAPVPFNWKPPSSPVSRSRSLRVEWSDPSNERTMLLFAVSIDETTGSGAVAYCAVASNAGQKLIPENLLSKLPSSRPGAPPSSGVLMLVALPATPVRSHVEGLDNLFATSAFLSAVPVRWR